MSYSNSFPDNVEPAHAGSWPYWTGPQEHPDAYILEDFDHLNNPAVTPPCSPPIEPRSAPAYAPPTWRTDLFDLPDILYHAPRSSSLQVHQPDLDYINTGYALSDLGDFHDTAHRPSLLWSDGSGMYQHAIDLIFPISPSSFDLNITSAQSGIMAGGSTHTMARTDSRISSAVSQGSDGLDEKKGRNSESPAAEDVKEVKKEGTGKANSRPRSQTLPNFRVVKQKGRTRKLTLEERQITAYMRRVKACSSCRKRKIACDDGIPCRNCIRHHGDELTKVPCRGDQLEKVAGALLDNNAFPKGGHERFLPEGCDIAPKVHTMELDLGFPLPFQADVKLIKPNKGGTSKSLFVHEHMDYNWPPEEGESQMNRKKESVFPAVLADMTNIESRVDTYLSALVNDQENFKWFPVWMSPLKVLRVIYRYYITLEEKSRSPLEKALKLLVLVHTGGDVRLQPSKLAIQIVEHYFKGYNSPTVTPCFIRAQLGPVFSKMAHQLMGQVLKELELLSPSTNRTTFPVVVATFSVLFMVMESLQFHVAKLPYHCAHDDPAALRVYEDQNKESSSSNQRGSKKGKHSRWLFTGSGAGNTRREFRGLDFDEGTRNLDGMLGPDILLRFYKATNCHAHLKSLGVVDEEAEDISSGGSDYDGVDPVKKFLSGLHAAIVDAKPYLEQKVKVTHAPKRDMSVFFDRLLAKLYLMEESNAI